MLRTFYTYSALAEEWDSRFAADHVAAIYSPRKNELCIELGSGSVIVLGSRGAFLFLFRSDAGGRPRRNVTDLLGAAVGARVAGVATADRDRVLILSLSDEREIRLVLFGSKPNVLLIAGGMVQDAFKDARGLVGSEAPAVRPVPRVTGVEAFLERARGASTPEKAVTSTFRLFDAVLAREVLHTAGVRDGATVEEALEQPARIFDAAIDIEHRVESSRSARIHRRTSGEVFFSLIELSHMAGQPPEASGDVDSMVSLCTRMILRELGFEHAVRPLRRAVEDRLQRSERRLREVGTHLDQPGRADNLERFGHLLMASGRVGEQGLDRIEVPDHFSTGEPVPVPLDPSLSVMENAEMYYDRARRSRASRAAARERLAKARDEHDRLQEVAIALERVVDMDGLQSFRRAYPEWSEEEGSERVTGAKPFRRYLLPGGFEVWVGRNARENDLLTFGHARKFDIWMHARGVGGSHVILRLPSRTASPGPVVLEAAASAAAYHSKARGSELVPVMYTERKYVRKVRGAEPGRVLVEREKVLIVPPAIPAN